MPSLTGSYFGDALIYICDHDESGAMGLMVNRPASLDLWELAKELDLPKPAAEKHVYVLEGGPVNPEQGLVLHTDGYSFASSRAIAPGLTLSSSRDAIAAIAEIDGPRHALITLGYAGWGPGQLEQELAEDAWLCVDASRTVLFDTPLEQRRQAAAASIGVDMRLMARQTGHA